MQSVFQIEHLFCKRAMKGVIMQQFVKLLIIIDLFHLALGQTLPPPRSVNDIANPLVDLEKCGRKGMRSHICDPDGIIPVEQAYQLDDIIRSIYNDTFCPCSPTICRLESQGGYLVGIAVIRAMRLERSIRRLNISREDQAHYMNAVLNEAKHFAYKLLQEWKMGRCGEDVLIFFSEHDSVLYTVTHPEAREKLTDDIVGEIAMHSRIHFSHRETITEGFKEMLNSYSCNELDEEPYATLKAAIAYVLVFLDNYKQKSTLESEQSEVESKQRLSSSDGNSLRHYCTAFPLLLSILLQLFGN